MNSAQAGILAQIPAAGRYLCFSLAQTAALREVLADLAALADGDTVVVALGPATVAALGTQVPGLHELPALSGPGVQVPSTPMAACCWLRGDDRGDLVNLTRRIERALTPALRMEQAVDAFRHRMGESGHGRDLTGYEDGTENPEGEAAETAALLQGCGEGLDGSSFVALQLWLHDFEAFEAMTTSDQDNAIGRRRSDNEELDGAPPAAHVKRTAQESFEPLAFVLRRSMPWATGNQSGLMFAAFGRSFDAFEAQMRRMAGLDDGIVDALFGFTRPITGAHLWCPPMRNGRLDLRRVGL